MLPLSFCTFEAERDSLDVAFGLVLVGAGMALVILPARWLAGRLINRESLVAEAARPGTFKGRWLPFVFLAPTLIILALFLYYPGLDNLRLSTLLYRLGAPRSAFVCVDNFTRLIDPDYGRSILITFGMSFAIVVIGLALGLLIATAAYQPITGARVYRTLLIWPYAISPVVAGIIFSLLFNPAGGIINYFLKGIFGITIPWLNDPTYAPWAVIIASVWKSLGFNILFYIAGLQNIPKDLLEAASIDGATTLQRFFRVTFPLLSPITFFLVVTNVTYAFFETVGTLVYMTGGAGPLGSTNTLMYRIYQLGILNNDMGKAAAQSIVLFLMVIALTVIQFRTASSRVTYGGA
ncbi:MAG: sugar ABC transporter permease [Anaerolineae bacterium]|nr:sugar ABC transporter permease [Anaerolineae bacterium]